MRTTKTFLVCVIGGTLGSFATAQEVVREPAAVAIPRETTASTTVQPIEVAGTVSQFGDGVIALSTAPSAPPIQYHLSKTTQWVDATGNLVTRETLKAGTPVTLYYTTSADGLLISKVVVRQGAAPLPPPATTVVEKRETIATTTIQPLQATGVVTTWGDGTLTVRVEGSAVPMQYLFGDTTKWFDDSGQVVTREMLRVGMPVTVVYARSDERLVASKILLRRPPPPVVTEKQESVVERPVAKAVEKRETVVKENPTSKVAPKRKVVVEEKASPKTIERHKKTVVEPKEPVVAEPPPIVERKTTTTTTTTTRKKGDHDDD